MSATLLGSLFFANQLNIYEDITKTLPQSEQFENLKHIIDHRGINNSIYFSVRKNGNWESAEMEETGISFCEDLSNSTKSQVADLKFQLSEEEEEIYDFIDARVPFYLNESDYNDLSERLSTDSVVQAINKNHERLFTPEGFVLKKYLLNDPVGITARALLQFKKLEDESVFEVRDNLFVMPDDGSLFISGNVRFDTESAEQKAELAKNIEEVVNQWRKDDYQLEYFSGFLIGQANADQIKADTTLTLTISLTAILLLLLLYYRSVYLPLFFVLPAAVGLIISVGLLALVKGEVSAISIGAGAVVLGIIMDYSFHFFTHLKDSGSIEETLEDVTNPLLTGCLTTILAFLALTFTNSPVLQDFGLFAAFSLIGAAFAVLFVLPVMLPEKLVLKWKSKTEKSIQFKLPKAFKLIGALLIIGFSVVAIMYASDIKFDEDLMNLNHYPEELKEAEKRFNRLDPDNERRIFVLSSDTEKEKAETYNYIAAQELKKLQNENALHSIVTTALFEVSGVEAESRVEFWNKFWTKHGKQLGATLDSMENALGYYENTFDSFKNKISGHYTIPANAKELPQASADVLKLVDSTKGEWTYVSYFTIGVEQKDSVVSALKSKLPNSEIFDRSAMAGSLVQMVQSDFNFILLTSSLLVFFTLLIIYGRIELTLITFLPMILSWVWILGIAALIGIEFNFVNIVISTFIFGLGDDFAIFITDGYVSKFARNKDVISSYKRGILLSAATTIIGTGALIFAVHPALNSVALISVIGMVAILIISFTVQPWLLRNMLLKRKKKGLPPVSLVNLLFSIYCFGFFLAGCFTLFPIQMILKYIPFGQKQLRWGYHKMMQIFAWMQIYFMVNVRKRVIGRENFDFSKPSVIIANHQSFIDVIMMMTFHPKVIIMTNDWVYNSPFFGAQIRYLGFFPGSHGVEKNLEDIRPWVEDGYSVILFPEGTRSKNKQIGRFHKGAFFIAEELKLDVIPVILHGFNDAMRKNDFMLLNAQMNVVVLPRIPNSDLSWGTAYKERGKAISNYFKKEFKKFDLANSDSRYLQHKILSNYIFKSPMIEWYVKVKWMFERKNFDHYHDLIPTKGKIYDLGCGYGYLSYYLHYRSEERDLVGIDYDEDKIEIANNGYLMNEHISFEAGDIRQIEYENASAIFLNDVVHYLPEEDHEKILEKCLDGLLPGGTLLIRDGVTDMDKRHKKTELTEKYSTQIIGFNKTTNHLCFFSKDFILDFAKKHNLTCQIEEQSSKTSNILFILKRELSHE